MVKLVRAFHVAEIGIKIRNIKQQFKNSQKEKKEGYSKFYDPLFLAGN